MPKTSGSCGYGSPTPGRIGWRRPLASTSRSSPGCVPDRLALDGLAHRVAALRPSGRVVRRVPTAGQVPRAGAHLNPNTCLAMPAMSAAACVLAFSAQGPVQLSSIVEHQIWYQRSQ